jgi:hypothetical protein
MAGAPRISDGRIETAFNLAAVPLSVVNEIEHHYATTGWHQQPSSDRFEWHGWAGGGVLMVPGRPNPMQLSWIGQWSSRDGDVVSYVLRADTEENDVLGHVYAGWHMHRA